MLADVFASVSAAGDLFTSAINGVLPASDGAYDHRHGNHYIPNRQTCILNRLYGIRINAPAIDCLAQGFIMGVNTVDVINHDWGISL